MNLTVFNNKNNKRLIFYVSFLILIFIAAPALTSCGGALKFKNDGDTGNLIDEENGRYYIYCGSYLRAAEIKSEVYAKGDQKEKLHEIIGIDPAKWLSENITLGIALLFREQGEAEPTLDEFETEIIHIAMTEAITLSLGAVTGKDDIEAIVNDYVNNKEVSPPDYVTENLTLYFESKKYSGIYYVLQYYADDKNNSYLYDRWTKRCVLCSVNIFE
ncbi:MAG: hypothetical protein FWD23_17060 [Oscillospiraceae bacterium]|nr:hypothetical protein [Oscillospiraceae bacterium]